MEFSATLNDRHPDAWHWRWLLAAPHRLAFFAAALMLALTGAWWATVLLMRQAGAEPAWAVAPPVAHSLWMGYGFMPLFFVGFLFTAGPKWLNVPGPNAAVLLAPVGSVLAGWALYVIGVHRQVGLAALGLALVAAGWSTLAWKFLALLRQSRARDRTHARFVALACVGIAIVLCAASLGSATGNFALVRAATQAGLWGCIAVVYAVVAHRMLPFFTAAALPSLDAWRPTALLWMFVCGLAFEAPFAAAEAFWWPLPAGMRWAQAMIEAPFAALLLWLAWRWGLVQSLKVRLLAMLHLGFLWLGIAYGLLAVSHVLMVATEGQLSLGLAPMHALTMGFLGSTLIAMATRVSCGHGGRTLVADDFVWRLFWLLQVAVVLRLVAALWAAISAPLLLLAALVWAGCVIAWALRYGNWFGRPRADGRPG